MEDTNRRFYASIIFCLLLLPTIMAIGAFGNLSSTGEKPETTTRTRTGETPKILVVFDDILSPYITPSNSTSALTEALDEAYPSASIEGLIVTPDWYDGPAVDGPSLGTLERYDIVIWETGSDNLNTLREKDREVLTNYLYRGGRLWLIGSGIVDDLVYEGDASFVIEFCGIYDYLGMGTAATLTGISGDPITDGMNIQTQKIYLDDGSGQSYDESLYTDNLAVGSGAVGILGHAGNYSAIRYYNTSYGYKTVFFGFDFGVIKEKADRVNICAKVVDWLGFRQKHTNDVGITDVYVPLISDVWSSEKILIPNAVTFGNLYGMAGKEIKINVTARNFDNKSHSTVEIVCEIYEYMNVSLKGDVFLRNRYSTTKVIPAGNETTVTFSWTPPAARYYHILAYTVLRSDTYYRNNVFDFGLIKIAKWYDNAESGTNGCTISNGADWNIIDNVPNDPNTYNHTGSHVWYCGNNATNTYSPNQDAYLISPTIDLTNMDNNYYSFFGFRINGKVDTNAESTQNDFLGVVVRNITDDTLGNWFALPYYYYDTASSKYNYAIQYYCGDTYGNLSSGWYVPTNPGKTYNYTGFFLNWWGDNDFGDKIQLGFWFKSDSNTVINPGFYLDDFIISGYEKYAKLSTDIGIEDAYDTGTLLTYQGIPLMSMASLGQVPISAVVKNYGTAAESFGVKLTILDGEGATQSLGDTEAIGGVKQVTSLGAGQNTTVTWNWRPTTTGTYYYRVEIQASDDNDLSDNIYENVITSIDYYIPITIVDNRNFTASSNDSLLYFTSGETKNVSFLLNATKGFSGNVAISTTAGSGWTVTVPSSVALGENESKANTVTITAPSSNTAQDTTLTIKATSTDPALNRTFNITVVLNETHELPPVISYGVELPSTLTPGSTKPGWIVNYTIPVKNTGNTNDSFSLSMSPPSGWSAEFRNSAGSVITSTGTIAPSQSADVILKITVPSSVSSGDYDATIIAASVGNISKSDTLLITTNVTTLQITPPVEMDFATSSQDIRYTPRVDIVDGNEVLIVATISNNGTSKTPKATVGFYLDGREASNKIGEATIPEIAPKGTEKASIKWIAVAGVHEIYVKVDPSNNVSEINEDNNIASVEIVAAQKPATTEGEGKGFVPGYELFIFVTAMGVGLLTRKHKLKI
ncbi:MAG: CARDB domain-containing protein [Thermoplasmata archaeon]